MRHTLKILPVLEEQYFDRHWLFVLRKRKRSFLREIENKRQNKYLKESDALHCRSIVQMYSKEVVIRSLFIRIA